MAIPLYADVGKPAITTFDSRDFASRRLATKYNVTRMG